MKKRTCIIFNEYRLVKPFFYNRTNVFVFLLIAGFDKGTFKYKYFITLFLKKCFLASNGDSCLIPKFPLESSFAFMLYELIMGNMSVNNNSYDKYVRGLNVF